MGGYDETPDYTSSILREFAESGLVNVVGGCCGTTPAHIRAIAEAVRGLPPRRIPEIPKRLRLSGLEPLVIGPDSNFVNVGERTNVTGSKKFAELILGGRLRPGARGRAAAGRRRRRGHRREHGRGHARRRGGDDAFLNLVASEPDISKVPVMIDSSKWKVIEAGLRCVQGKGDRELDLDEGRRGRVRAQATLVRRYGARRDRHGVRRAGPGRHGGAEGRHLRAGLPAAHRAGRVPARGHHLRPEHLRDRDGDRGARRATRSPSSRRPAASRNAARTPASPAA
jgi:hypothetical protein